MAKSSSFPTIGFLVICLLLATFFSAIHCSVSEGGKSGKDEEGPGERIPEKDLGSGDGKLGKDWESAEEGKQGKYYWGSRRIPGRYFGSAGSSESEGGKSEKDWGSRGYKIGKDWGSGGARRPGRHLGLGGGGGKPGKDWGSRGYIPSRDYVGLGPGGEWESERSWGSERGRSEKDWGPREGTPRGHYEHGGGWSGRHWGSEGGWSGRSSPSYSPCYIKYNHVPHGHDSWCCGLQISISPMCWKSESQCKQTCRLRRRNHHH